MNNSYDATANFLIDYCVANNIRYQKDGNFVRIYFPGDYIVVYYPEKKSLFFSGVKVLESPNLDHLKNFLDFIR